MAITNNIVRATKLKGINQFFKLFFFIKRKPKIKLRGNNKNNQTPPPYTGR